MTWAVRVHEDAAKQLKAIPPDRRKRILDDVVALEEDPFRGLVNLSGAKSIRAGFVRFPAATASFSSQPMQRGPWTCSQFSFK
jgi:hypothetical protein